MNTALYARVSSEKQAEKDLSLPAQLKTLREYALKRNWTIVEEFIDEAESARTADRPAFQRMIASAKQKEPPFQIILVWKLNRFARNREDSIIYKSLLRKRGIQIISINENLDEGPTGKLLEGIIESIDEFYSANLSQDTIRGLKENAMRGFWNGGVPPYGYTFEFVKVNQNTKRRLTLKDGEAKIVKEMFALSLKGEGIKDIAKKLNREGIHKRTGRPWSNTTVSYVLRNPIYTGNLYWQEARHNPNAENPVITIPNTHPLIIPEQVFQQVRKKIYARTRHVINSRILTSPHLLSGFLRCKRCGAQMTSMGAKSGKYFYYVCQTYMKSGRDYCTQKSLPAKKIEPFIIASIQDGILSEPNLQRMLLTINDEAKVFNGEYKQKMSELDALIEEKHTRRAKLFEGIETGTFDLKDVSPRLKCLNDEIASIQTQRADLTKKHNSERGFYINEEGLKPFVEDLRETLLQGTIAQRRGFIRSFIKRIEIDYPEAKIDYTIPMPQKIKARTSTEEVLATVQNGVAG
jgi:DNA invertase Pin-like site-specific DNA recombinase